MTTTYNGETGAGHIHATVGPRAWHSHRPPVFEREIYAGEPRTRFEHCEQKSGSGFQPFNRFAEW